MSFGWRAAVRDVLLSVQARALNEDSPQADQPAHIKLTLRPHQRTLVAGARELERRTALNQVDVSKPQLLTKYGVIADRVGAGKSIVALSLVKDPAPQQFTNVYTNESGGANLLSFHTKTRSPPITIAPEMFDVSDCAVFVKHLLSQADPDEQAIVVPTALIIVPHTVVPQWESYIRDQTTLSAYVVRRTAHCAYDTPGFYHRVFGSDVVLVSSTMIRHFMGALSFHNGLYFRRIVWSRVFVDEADSITLPVRYGEISARFFWLITGSYLNVLFPNGIRTYMMSGFTEETRALLGDGLVSGFTGSAMGFAHNLVANSERHPIFAETVVRNAPAWIDQSLKQPIVIHDTILCKAPVSVKILQNFITPAALEALHAGDVAGAMTALGLEATTKESLVTAVTASIRRDIVQAEKLLAFKHEMEYSSAAAKADGIKRAEAKVTALQEKLAALEARVLGADAEVCPICYDAPNTPTLTPCCRQTFCLACVCECVAKKPTCPLCRAPIRSVKGLAVIGATEAAGGAGAGAGATAPADELPAKGAALLQLLISSAGDANPANRFLVFSAHEASFKGLREVLAKHGVRCELLMGTAARIQRLRKQFADGKVHVLCMNARHVGAGLNLEMATHVVLYHKMNVELEAQVIGRALRFERTTELRVTHLVHAEETGLSPISDSDVIVHA